jgi:hypothetical protein
MAAPWEKDWSGFAAAPVNTDTASAAPTTADVKPWERDWAGAGGAAAPIGTVDDVAKSARAGRAGCWRVEP